MYSRKMIDITLFCQTEDHNTYSILSLQLNILNIAVQWLEHKTYAEERWLTRSEGKVQ